MQKSLRHSSSGKLVRGAAACCAIVLLALATGCGSSNGSDGLAGITSGVAKLQGTWFSYATLIKTAYVITADGKVQRYEYETGKPELAYSGKATQVKGSPNTFTFTWQQPSDGPPVLPDTVTLNGKTLVLSLGSHTVTYTKTAKLPPKP